MTLRGPKQFIIFHLPLQFSSTDSVSGNSQTCYHPRGLCVCNFLSLECSVNSPQLHIDVLQVLTQIHLSLITSSLYFFLVLTINWMTFTYIVLIVSYLYHSSSSHTHLSENSKRAMGLLCANYVPGIMVGFGEIIMSKTVMVVPAFMEVTD